MTTYIFVIASEEILKEYYCCCPHLRSLYCDPNPLNEVLDFGHSCSLSDAKGTIHTDVLRSRTCGRTAILNCNLQCVVVFKCISRMERKGYDTGVDLMVRSGFREYEEENCVLLPEAGRKTQFSSSYSRNPERRL